MADQDWGKTINRGIMGSLMGIFMIGIISQLPSLLANIAPASQTTSLAVDIATLLV